MITRNSGENCLYEVIQLNSVGPHSDELNGLLISAAVVGERPRGTIQVKQLKVCLDKGNRKS